MSVRSVAATVQGLRLHWWRHGVAADRAAEEAQEREHWCRERWHAWRQEQLARLLDRAATRVPYYRELWAARRRRGDHASWELLENWPILEKHELRRAPRAFVADDWSVLRMPHVRTSGTTGTPLDLWRSRAAVQTLYGIGITRTRGPVDAVFVGTLTPIDADSVHVRFSIALCRARGFEPDTGLGRATVAEIVRQMEQDIPIWENKVFRPEPLLCEGDGPIPGFRRWARQFYTAA